MFGPTQIPIDRTLMGFQKIEFYVNLFKRVLDVSSNEGSPYVNVKLEKAFPGLLTLISDQINREVKTIQRMEETNE